MNRRKIFLILTLLWMVVIFCFSARNADLSTEDSYRVGMLVGDIVVPGFKTWPEADRIAFAATIDHPVRKTAHATEYAILAMLTCGAMMPASLGKTFLCSWLIATIYACTDEFHQLFVPGRSGQVSDVCIDSLGAMAGLLLIWGIFKIIKKQENYGLMR